MTLEEASKIVNLYGIYLEHIGGKLAIIFGGNIPESFLPFPKKTLEEALNIVSEFHHSSGNFEMVNILKGTIGALCAYEKDEKSLLQAVKHFNDPSWRKTTLPIFENFQNEWIKMQKNL